MSDSCIGGWRGLADNLNLDASTQNDIAQMYEDRCGGVLHCWERREGRNMQLKLMYNSLKKMKHRASLKVLDEFLSTCRDKARQAVENVQTKVTVELIQIDFTLLAATDV